MLIEGVKYKDERLAPFENAKIIKIKMIQNSSDNNVVVDNYCKSVEIGILGLWNKARQDYFRNVNGCSRFDCQQECH